MADAFYDEFRNGILGNGTHAQPDLDTNDIRCALRDEVAVALNLATQIDQSDVTTGSGHVQASGALTKTVGSAGVGAFDHTLVTFTSVASPGNDIASIDYYDFQTAVATTSPMICNIDSATGLPVTANGGDITWDPAAGGVFQLLGS